MSGACLDRNFVPASLSGSPKRILLVDDDDGSRQDTKWFLANFGYAVDPVRSGQEALTLFDAGNHDLVITKNIMPGMTGAELAQVIKQRSSSTPVLMYTTHPPDATACIDLVIQRPTNLFALKQGVEQLLAGASTRSVSA